MKADPAADAACRIAAALLRQGAVVNIFALVVLAAALFLAASLAVAGRLALPVALPLVVLVLAHLGQFWFAIRVGFDAELFDALARNALSLGQLDEGLARLELAPAEKSGRAIEERLGGARRLLMRQILLAGAELVLLVSALAMLVLR